MTNYDSNYAIAQEISARIGVSPIPFDSVYSIALEIYNELGGEPTQFDSVYSILLGILPLVEGGVASKVIDDNVITTVKTWSSSKINSELASKTNKADYVVGLLLASPGSMPELDLTPLNSATTDGIYSIIVKTDLITGVEEYIGFGQMSVFHAENMGGVIVQGINITYNIEATKNVIVSRVCFDGTNWDNVKLDTAVIDDNKSFGAPWSTTFSATKIEELLAAKQGTLTAGDNIDITGNTISAKGYVYNTSNGAFEHYDAAHDGDSSTVGDNEALGQNSVVFGQANKISADGEGSAIIGGQNNVISGVVSVIAGGYSNNVSGNYSFAEGEYNTVTGSVAHAEGEHTTASGTASHAEGQNTIASGQASHVEGALTKAIGNYSHAEGYETQALGNDSHAEGYNTIAYGGHAEGYWNIPDNTETTVGSIIYNSRYTNIVGNGYSNNRSNAYTLGLNGKGWYQTDVMCGGSNEDTAVHKLSEKQNVLTAGTNITISGTTISATYEVASTAEIEALFA